MGLRTKGLEFRTWMAKITIISILTKVIILLLYAL